MMGVECSVQEAVVEMDKPGGLVTGTKASTLTVWTVDNRMMILQ